MVELLAGGAALPRHRPLDYEPDDDGSRQAAFDNAVWQASLGQVIDHSVMHASTGLSPDVGLRPGVFRDRRGTGRRYRPTFNGDDEANRPYDNRGLQADLPIERYRSI
jgi:hypothetical protein